MLLNFNAIGDKRINLLKRRKVESIRQSRKISQKDQYSCFEAQTKDESVVTEIINKTKSVTVENYNDR